MRNQMKRKLIIAVGLVALGALVFTGSFLILTGQDETAIKNEGIVSIESREASIPPEVLERRGPRPPVARIREGKQIEDSLTAAESLDNSLKRVEEELESDSTEEARQALKRKREIINGLKARLDRRLAD